MTRGCELRPLTELDFEPIRSRVDAWWGRPVSDHLPRLFFEHFQSMSRVAEVTDEGRTELAGFLIAFQSQTDARVCYVHFVGVAPAYRNGGVGRALYTCLFERARNDGARVIEAITAPVNRVSIGFHQHLGFEVLPGDTEVEGVPCLRDHSGPGKHRVRLRKVLAPER